MDEDLVAILADERAKSESLRLSQGGRWLTSLTLDAMHIQAVRDQTTQLTAVLREIAERG